MARRPDVPCSGCGKLLWGGRTSLGPGERMCRACRATAGRCAMCGLAMPTYHARQRHCSDRCRGMASGRYNLASPIGYGTCVNCGSLFVRRSDRVGQFCSRSCKNSTKARDRGHVVRSAHDRGDSITIHELGERDGWRCHICGTTTTRRPSKRHPQSPTIDHLVPIVDGGEHSWVNVALAHRLCNVRRRDVGPAQLRLLP